MATQVVLLGTGNPNPDPVRSGPSTAIIVDDRAYLIDAGPGVVRRAQEAYMKGVAPLRSDLLSRLFITHLHSDHTIGLPDLILTPWVMERKKPLRIWGPPGTREMVKHILAAYREDIEIRKKGLEKANETGYRVSVNEIGEGKVHEGDDLLVEALKVKHGAWRHSYAFRFTTPDRVVVVSGDCAPTEETIEFYRGCDVLVHDVYSSSGFEKRPERWKAYHRNSHTSSLELARIASEVGPGTLVLTHQLMWGATPGELLDEIGSVYGGRVHFGNDLDVI